MWRSLAAAVAGSLVSLLLACFADPGGGSTDATSTSMSTTSCPLGTLGCPCAGGSCDGDLVCEERSCVEPADTGSGTSSGSTTGTSMTTGTSTTGTSSTTGPISTSGETGSTTGTTGGEVTTDASGSTTDTIPTPYGQCESLTDCEVPDEICFVLGGLSLCSLPCEDSSECPDAPFPDFNAICAPQEYMQCVIPCQEAQCPDMMSCVMGICLWA